MAVNSIRLLCDDLMFAESPRWREGRLYLSDFYANEVVSLNLDGSRDVVVKVLGQPSGLGWLPNGDMLIAAMRDANVLRFDGNSLECVATARATSPMLNDMVVAASGRAYVGGTPDLYAMLRPGSGRTIDELKLPREHLYVVEPQTGSGPFRCAIAASELNIPNGMAITPDGQSLIVAETMANRLIAFDIQGDGSLANRRVWADLGEMPDGICLDAEGCVWVAIPDPPEAQGFCRIAEGGEIMERLETDRSAIAVELGGDDGHDLFLVEAKVAAIARAAEARVRGNARVRVGKVDVPGAAYA